MITARETWLWQHGAMTGEKQEETEHSTTGAAETSAPVRYPENHMMFAPDVSREQEARWREFYDRREAMLLNYGYNTARAYYADLQDIFEWAVERGKDVLALTEQDLKQYCALLRRRSYSESTVRRRCSAWRGLASGHG